MLIVLVGSLPFVLNVAADPDLWWHIRTGELILDQGTVPQADTWSFTAVGQQWTNHEWLSSVIFAQTFSWFGSVGLLVLRNILFVGLVGGLVLVYASRVRQPLLVLLLVLVTVPVFGVFINVRAHSFTYFLVVWTIVALDRVRDRQWGWLVALPVISGLWANLHGGFALGLGLIGGSLLLVLLGWDGAAERPIGRPRQWIIWTGLATVATTLINPFGWWLYIYVFEELGAEHVLVSEWQPIEGDQIVFFWIYLLVPVGLWLMARRWRHVGLLVMLLLTTLLTSQAARFFVLMAIFGSIVAVGAIGELLRRHGDSGIAKRYAALLDPRVALASAAALTIVLGVPFVAGVAGGDADVTVDTSLYPIEATAWLADQDISGNVATPLPYGGYSIWNLVPEFKVAVDGRNVTLYESEWIDSYLLALDEGRALDVIDEQSIDAWLLRVDEEGEQIAALEATGRWSVAYRDDVAAVVLPGDHATLIGPPTPRNASFPGSGT